MNALRCAFLLLLFVSSFALNGQPVLKNDTINIGEVIIDRKNLSASCSPFKTNSIDSSEIENMSQFNIARLISEKTIISFKSYGPGGSATISIRGTGAGHTKLEWNGININSPMLGQADFTLIPVSVADRINISFGGASMELGSGGIGGIVNIETGPVWKRETSIALSAGTGSFGSWAGAIEARGGDAHFQSNTKASFHSSENNFIYLNSEAGSEPVLETMKNSSIRDKSFLQELYFRSGKDLLSARIWYQSTSRELPASMLNSQPDAGESQFDESFRTMLSYDFKKNKNDFSLKSAWMTSRLNYTNKMASVDSRNIAQTLILRAEAVNNSVSNTKFIFSVNDELNYINSNNYENRPSRNAAYITVSAERNVGRRVGATVLFRETILNSRFITPDFSAGFRYRMFATGDYFLKAGIARNSKIPSMNDMYWYPGGNINLKNEYAFQYELSSEMTQKLSSVSNLFSEVTLFRNSIKDMILWHPGENSYWTADNIQNVNTSGLESTLRLDYLSNGFGMRFNVSYSYTRAYSGTGDINGLKNQMAYIPINKANTSVNLSFRKYYAVWDWNLTGKRYTSADNSRLLPGYVLSSIMAGTKFNIKGSHADVSFNIDNLFNISYQAIAHYPMPGRSYFLKLVFEMIK